MSEAENEINYEESSLVTELLHYYDEFSEFDEDCAFLCEAFSAVIAESSHLDLATVGGFQRNAHWLKRRAGELKSKLARLQESAVRAGE